VSDNGAGGAGNGVKRPALRIVRGNPSDEELAALTVLFAAFPSGSPEPLELPEPEPAPSAGRRLAATRRGRWNDPAHGLRRTWLVGVGGWQAAR
jgi:hypothetical protein